MRLRSLVVALANIQDARDRVIKLEYLIFYVIVFVSLSQLFKLVFCCCCCCCGLLLTFASSFSLY